MTPRSLDWWGLCCWSRTRTGSWKAVACSQPTAWPPFQPWRHCQLCRTPGIRAHTQAPGDRGSGARQRAQRPRPGGRYGHNSAMQSGELQKQSHAPRERLDRSISWIHGGDAKRNCTSGMTIRHPPSSHSDRVSRASAFTPRKGAPPQQLRNEKKHISEI
mgnify:CR=1 FL=1